jgi:hypothetical protein
LSLHSVSALTELANTMLVKSTDLQIFDVIDIGHFPRE